MEVYFYSFDKRKNSTARPSGTGTKYDVELKEGADFDRPTFKMHNNVTGFNYAKWNDAFYFIVDRQYVYADMWEITCEIDVLGSYRGSIKASTQYVLRTSTDKDLDIFDNYYPLKINPTVTIEELDLGFVFEEQTLDVDGPTVLLSVKGASGTDVYAMTMANFREFSKYFYGLSQDTIWNELVSSTGSLPSLFEKHMMDPFSYITDVRIVPIPYKNISGSAVGNIKLGFWEFATDPYAAGKRVKNTIYSSGIKTGNVPAAPTGDKAFLESNKARDLQMFIPGCGMQSFDADKCKGATNFHLNYVVDKKGVIAYYVYINDEIHYCSADISLPMAVYCNILNVGGAVAGLTRTAGGVAAGLIAGNVPGAVIGGITGAISGIASASPLFTQQNLGSDGSWAALASQPKVKLMVTQYDCADLAPAIFGYPVCKSMTLGTNGYYLIKDAQVGFGDDNFIKESIKGFMESGFYIE